MKPVRIILTALGGLAVLGSAAPRATDPSFAIYILNDSARGVTHHAQAQTAGRTILPPEPWLTLEDIAAYDYSAHCIYLAGTRAELAFPEAGRSFAVVAGDEVCYVGSFCHWVSPTIGHAPRIATPIWNGRSMGPVIEPDDIILVGDCLGDPDGSADVRNDDRVRSVFAHAGKLREGLRVTLDSVRLLERGDTTTIAYTFTVINRDRDALYVMDPDRMGADLFHFYTNGVQFRSRVRRTCLWSNRKLTRRPADGLESNPSWGQDWLTPLASGESMTRTVTLRGYPKIPPAHYTCSFVFPGARVARDSRSRPEGRIWVGGCRSSELSVAIAE